MAVTTGIHSEKAQLYGGEPTEIRHDPRELDEIMRRLNEIAPALFIDAGADEVQDAEVVEPTALSEGS